MKFRDTIFVTSKLTYENLWKISCSWVWVQREHFQGTYPLIFLHSLCLLVVKENHLQFLWRHDFCIVGMFWIQWHPLSCDQRHWSPQSIFVSFCRVWEEHMRDYVEERGVWWINQSSDHEQSFVPNFFWKCPVVLCWMSCVHVDYLPLLLCWHCSPILFWLCWASSLQAFHKFSSIFLLGDPIFYSVHTKVYFSSCCPEMIC